GSQSRAEVVSRIRDADPLRALRRLCHVGIDAELDPAGYVPARIECRTLDLFEDPVVLARVTSEIWLDGNELGTQQALLGEHERLDDPRQPPIAIAKWVNRNKVQVGHRRAKDGMAGYIT